MNTAPPKVTILGVAFDSLDYEELCACIDLRIASREPGYVVTPNTDHVCRYHRDPDFQHAYAGAFLVLPDGVPILWAAWLFRTPLRQKLSGSDLVPALAAYAAERGYSVYFLGGYPGTAAATARILKGRHPALRVAGVDCPEYGFHLNEARNGEVLQQLKASQADICFVALGSPKQELWMRRHYGEASVPVMIGVGGTLDFVSGRIRRAPKWVQKAGFEWLWRLCQEPRRLWHRYLVEDMLIFKLLWRESRQRRRKESSRPEE